MLQYLLFARAMLRITDILVYRHYVVCYCQTKLKIVHPSHMLLSVQMNNQLVLV